MTIMLTLPIKKKWFDMIAEGQKKEEYRELSDYYSTRFENAFGFYFYNSEIVRTHYYKKEIEILLRNGYSAKSPTMKVKVSISIGYGKEEWGAEPGIKYFVLKILEVNLLDSERNK